jgi:hypothetical protein
MLIFIYPNRPSLYIQHDIITSSSNLVLNCPAEWALPGTEQPLLNAARMKSVVALQLEHCLGSLHIFQTN